ncbi:MAG: hypothetical protein QE271_08460 [Bacteriovoracaceae bacterium]|nr:hypothetical protein [Bacteriovoracaceae bacterium]
MKQQKLKFFMVSVIFFLWSQFCAAQNIKPKEGNGSSGGGHVVEVGGRLELVDLVTSATCDWLSGEAMMAKNPHISQLLLKIEKLDWYLALELKREIAYLSWCMTGKLYSISAIDRDSFVQQLINGVQQVAFRYGDSAYIDQFKFLQLTSKSQTYLVFHETLHSYLPMDLEMRKFKLMSLVSTLRKVDDGQITSREALHLSLSKNEMNFPLTANKLEPYKKSIEFLLSNLISQSKIFLQSMDPEKLIDSRLIKVQNFVAPWDKAILKSPNNVLINIIKETLLTNNLQNAKRILTEQNYQVLNPATIGLSIFDELSLEVQSLVLNSSFMLKAFQQGMDYFNSMEVTTENHRILASQSLQSLSDFCQNESPLYLTSLLSTGACPLPNEILGVANLIITLANRGEIKLIKEQFFKNQEFISALKMSKVFEQLTFTTPAISREKELGFDILKQLQKNMVDKLNVYITERINVETATIIKDFFDGL